MAKKYKFIDIADFQGIKTDLHLGDMIKKNAKTTVKYLKEESPKSKKKKEDRKRYKSKWRYKYYEQYEMAVVYNEQSNLTYLLEHGHFIANKVGGVGWASARPHIQNVYEILPESMNKIIKETDIDFDIY